MNLTKLLLVLLIFCSLNSASRSYSITPLNSSSGLLYNHLGKAKLSNSKFTLLTYLNLTQIDYEIQNSYLLYYKSLAVCNKLISKHISFHCQNQLNYLKTKLNLIQSDYSIISHQLSMKRQKRGIINLVGDGLKWLFGTPDASDAQYYTDSINMLVSNQKQTETLMQQQVRIVSSTIKNFNNSLHIVNQNTKILNDNIKKFDDFMSRTQNNEETIYLENEINQHVTILVEMTDETKNKLDNYINAISLINKGIISYNILSPEDLFSELKDINTKNNLPLELSLESTYVYYRIMNINSFIKDNLLIISLNIPITNTIQYDLFEIHSLPTPHQGDSKLFSYIETNKPYILFSVTRTVYSTLNNLKKCQEYYPTQWLCKEVAVSKRINQEVCEIQLFFKTTNLIPKTCQVRHMYADAEMWHKIATNEWLYILSKPTSVNILCHSSEGHEEILNKIGILKLDPYCKAYTDHTILEAEYVIQTFNITNKIPSTDITLDDCCQKLKENITFNNAKLSPITLSNVDLNELKYAQHKLNQFDEILQQQLKQPYIIQHSNWFITVLSSIGGIVLIFISYKLLKCLGVLKVLRKYFCFNNQNYEPHQSKSNCWPCVNIYNQSYNRRNVPTTSEENKEIVVKYDSEMERLYYPTTSTQPNPVKGRKSIKSTDSRGSTPLRLTNV